jgi:predicted porin
MQKKLIAVVVGGMLAAPVAFADSANVTISGLVKVGLESYKLSGGTVPAVTYANETRVSDQSSRIIFTGSDGIGGGMNGFFQLDARFAPDLGSLAATGNTGVGLSGDFGKLTLGRWDLHYNEFGAIESSRAGSLQSYLGPGPMSQVNGNVIAIGSRSSNVIMWDSTNMGGITARVAYSTNPAANEGSGSGAADAGKDSAMTGAVRWASGPLTVGGSYWAYKVEGTTDVGDQKSTRAWGGYTFPFGLKVGAGIDQSELRITTAGAAMTKRKAFMVPVSYTMGNNAVYFTYVKANKLSGPNGGATTDSTDATGMVVGWDNALSKRTTVGAYFSKLTNKANASYDFFGLSANGATATANGEDARQIYLGIAHTF